KDLIQSIHVSNEYHDFYGGILVIGVTGGVGSGKTVFASELGKLRAHVIDVDTIARSLIDKSVDIQTSLRKTFGYGIFDEYGRLRRRELGRIVFTNSEKLTSLNQIFYSPLTKKIKAEILSQQNKEKEIDIVVDMAILFEARFEVFCDIVIIIIAPLERRVNWLFKVREWSFEEIFSRIHTQKSIEQNMGKADVIIENSGTLAGLRRKAREFYKKYVLSQKSKS
ncbi:dephospho-CoA kinase, partial [bacterium]|nr:dephospho-CoA kinase [bacterium]